MSKALRTIPTDRYSDEDLKEFRENIDKKLEAAQKELAYIQGLITRSQDPDLKEEPTSHSMDVFHLQQMATRQEAYIIHLQEAIDRIENGTYGICRVTKKLIGKARLRSVPHTTLSLEVKMGRTPAPSQKEEPQPNASKTIKHKSIMQKITINTDVLKPALSILKEAISIKPSLPILADILCRVSENKVELIASNLGITIYERLECDTEGESFTMVLPFMFLAKIVAINKNCPLSFTVEGKGVCISAVKEVYFLKNLPNPEDFPKLPNLPTKNRITLPAVFDYWLFAALETIDKTKTRYDKVLLEFKKSSITLASSDGSYNLFSYTLNPESGSDQEDDLLIPENAIKALTNIDAATISWTAKIIGFDTPNRTIILTRSEEKYSNFRAIIPADFTPNIELKRSEIIQALENCCLNSDPFKTTILNLKNKSAVQFKAYDHNFERDICIDVEGEYTGDVEQISFNAEKMLELMHQVEYDMITMAIHSDKKAMLFRSPADDKYLALLMSIHPTT